MPPRPPPRRHFPGPRRWPGPRHYSPTYYAPETWPSVVVVEEPPASTVRAPAAGTAAMVLPVEQQEQPAWGDTRVRPRIRVTGPALGPKTLVVEDATFRCHQPLAALAAIRGGTLHVLIRPRNMRPTTVDRCGSRFNTVRVALPHGGGWLRVAVWTRQDEYGGPSSPVLAGAVQLGP